MFLLFPTCNTDNGDCRSISIFILYMTAVSSIISFVYICYPQFLVRVPVTQKKQKKVKIKKTSLIFFKLKKHCRETINNFLLWLSQGTLEIIFFFVSVLRIVTTLSSWLAMINLHQVTFLSFLSSFNILLVHWRICTHFICGTHLWILVNMYCIYILCMY